MYDQSYAELQDLKSINNARISELREQVGAIESTYKENVASTEPIIANSDGLQARIDALGSMENQWPSIFIMLLFFAFETAPIFSKILSPIGEYERALRQLDHRKENLRKIIRDRMKVNDNEELEDVYSYLKKKNIIEQEIIVIEKLLYNDDLLRKTLRKRKNQFLSMLSDADDELINEYLEGND
jgi:hypothetical protein